ncbi:hypothetical protein [Microbaculum sp. FT89]|uniref:hypothetical protein n=1 Tax=Microbaculum sp. FT89 TaxID=3447298 RepID=UPI003F52B0A4
MYEPDERDELITRVQAGELTPNEAEAEAERRGLKPLRDDPDPSDFDPMNEPNWTLPMAVAWIAYRTPEAVREWWDDYRTRCWDWRELGPRNSADGPAYTGFYLEPRERANLDSLHFEEMLGRDVEEDDESLVMSVSAAIKDLKVTLGIPSLPATGVNASTGIRERIPAELWQDLDFTVVNKRDIVRTVNEEGRGYVRYDHVTVPRDAMWQLWGPRSAQGKPELPPLMKPEGAGYMPLSCAAQWIATEGGTVDFDPEDPDRWKPAFDTLIDHIASGEVAISGEPGEEGGMRERIDGTAFAGCEVDYPFSDDVHELYLSGRFYIRSYPYLDEEHWRGGFDDAYGNRSGWKWRRLMVQKSDVARIWPFGAVERAASDAANYRTGAPGKPSSMHLAEAEFTRRCERGEVAETVTRESEHLASWLKQVHPDAPPLTAKTIKNRIAAPYREYRRAKNTRN